MSIAASAIVIQASDHAQMKYQWAQAYAGYFAIAITALVLALVIWIFIRTMSRRNSNQ